MERKYQVFVSSTYEDLQRERQEVMNALLELDCIPSGMELFPAANEDQWTLIKGVIDDCDYYVVVIAGRYGSIGPDGLSYTEMEYRHAVDKKKPVIAFLHKEPGSIPQKFTESAPEAQRKLTEFRQLAESKMCKYWRTPEELGSVVSRSLIMLQKKHPGVGWVRGDMVPQKEASLEILELRKQIDSLQAKLQEARTQAPPGTETLARGEEKFEIHCAVETRDAEHDHHDWGVTVSVSWDEIFYAVSPLMLHEATDTQLNGAVEALVKAPALEELRKSSDVGGHYLRGFSINFNDFQTIKVQLRALGLITQSIRNRSIKDKGTYWTLTPYGDSVMNRLRAIKSKNSLESLLE